MEILERRLAPFLGTEGLIRAGKAPLLVAGCGGI